MKVLFSLSKTFHLYVQIYILGFGVTVRSLKKPEKHICFRCSFHEKPLECGEISFKGSTMITDHI